MVGLQKNFFCRMPLSPRAAVALWLGLSVLSREESFLQACGLTCSLIKIFFKFFKSLYCSLFNW